MLANFATCSSLCRAQTTHPLREVIESLRLVRTRSAKFGSRLDTGSSARRRRGRVRRVRQAATLCLSPRDSDVHWSVLSESPNCVSRRRASFCS